MAPAETGGRLVIEEPAPPESFEPVSEEPATPKPEPRRRRAAPAETPTGVEPAPETVEPPAAEVPALEPRGSPDQQNTLRRQIADMQQSLHQRIAQLEGARLTRLDPKTLEGARQFLSQSEKALESGDLQRALNLARKASQLVDALEQQP